MTQWQGEFQFFWRVKIKALEAVYARYPLSALLYVDSDMFLAGNLTALSSHFAQGGCVMHLAECRLADNTDKTLRKMHRTLHGKTIAGVEIGDDSLMWNAGVIGLCAQKAKSIIALSLQLCDEICATNCPRRLVEQFSFLWRWHSYRCCVLVMMWWDIIGAIKYNGIKRLCNFGW